jgi:poly(hydroxyalkanoate) granule-associated protein
MPKKKSIDIQKMPPENSVVEVARQIWLAGLGAFVKVEEEGTKVFETLVQEGEKIEAHTRRSTQDTVDVVKNKLEDTVEEVKEKATDTLDGIEQLFEDRVARVLTRMGIPTYEDVQALIERMENLSDNIKTLREKP